MLGRLIGSAIFLILAVFIEKHTDLPAWQLLLIYLLPYLIAGYHVVIECIESLFHGELLDENFLMTIATVGAFCIGFFPDTPHMFPEAVFVMLFFQIGEFFEGFAEGKSRKSISHLMDLRPDVATVERDGKTVEVNPDEVKPGEIAIVKPGEKVPFDGIIIEGQSSLNTVALTGESLPKDVAEEDNIMSGCVNINGLLKVKVTKPFGESTAAKILELVENASENKSKSEKFITRFARVYTPIVVVSALLLAFLPPIILGDFATSFPIWLQRALTFLVVSCPCALVISVPLSFFGGIGGASSNGVLIKGSVFMEKLAKTSTVVFDKTGTLTHGVFEVAAVHPDKCSETHLLHLAAHVERFSTHPIAMSLKAAYPDEQDDCSVSGIEEVPGKGIKANINGQIVCVGNSAMMESVGASWRPCHRTGTIIHVSIDGTYAGHIVISDKIKEDSRKAIAELHQLGIRKTVMLTGDRDDVSKNVAEEVGIDEYHAELLPADKVSCLEKLLEEKPEKKSLVFLGDGINDAPVLARADVGIAMGGLGSDAAIEAADVVIMDDKPSKLAMAIKTARKTLSIAKQNIVFAIGIKVAVLILAAFGLASMWMAVFADVGVTFIAVLNAMRTLKLR